MPTPRRNARGASPVAADPAAPGPDAATPKAAAPDAADPDAAAPDAADPAAPGPDAATPKAAAPDAADPEAEAPGAEAREDAAGREPISPLQLSALAVLAERPRHPYEVYQLMQERREDRVVKLRAGSLYHAINRLAQLGLVSATGTEREGNRPERTTYRISDVGRATLTSRVEAMLAARAEEYPEFPLAVAEMHNVQPAAARKALEERLVCLRAELGRVEEDLQRVELIDLPDVLWLDSDYLAAMLRADLTWVEQVLDRLRSGELGWDRRHLATGRATRRQSCRRQA